jgi:hypothetical protein
MNILRYSLAKALLIVYIGTRLLLLVTVRSDPALYDAIDRYANRPLPKTVCYPVPFMEDEIGYWTTLYAVIPSIMMPPGTPCATVLTR